MRTALVLGAVAALAAAGGGTAYYLNHRAGAEQDRAATAVIDAFAAGWQKQDPSGVPFAQADAAASFTPTVEGLGHRRWSFGQAGTPERRPGHGRAGRRLDPDRRRRLDLPGARAGRALAGEVGDRQAGPG